MIQETHTPESLLKAFVAQFIYFKGYKPEHEHERVVPDGKIYLVFELDGMPRYEIDNETLERGALRTKAWIAGMHMEFITISALQNSEMFAIQFHAHGLYPFIQQSVNTLNNKIIEPEEHFGGDVLSVRDRLLAASNPKEKFIVCEEWLIERFSSDHLPDPVVLEALSKIQSNVGFEINSIASFVEESGFSKKHFTELFKKYIGLTPKQFHRVIRFNELLAAIQKEEKIDWAQIALGCGYYDQAHFIKEFNAFSGINPSAFITNYREFKETNFFPLD